jgi:hypothetical protein
VLQNSQVVPTYLSAFIDCQSRHAVEGPYYFRKNLDVLIDSLIHALSIHGAPLQLYVDELWSDHSDRLTSKDLSEK